MWIKVSVIIPCFNEPVDVFSRSIESVVNQTLKEIEIIIILDNPSNNELKSVIQQYREKYSNIVSIYPEKNLWRWPARNLWIAQAKGEFIAIHDADDIDVPERLEIQYNFMKDKSRNSVLFANYYSVNENWESVGEIDDIMARINIDSIIRMLLNHCTMFLPKELINTFQYSDDNYCEDFDLWVRMFLDKVNFLWIEDRLVKYLEPSESPHSNFLEKIIQWRIAYLKILLRHRKQLYTDKLYFWAILYLWKKEFYNQRRQKLNNIFKYVESIIKKFSLI